MRSPAFRNSKGNLIDLHAVPATRLKNAFGAVLQRAVQDGAVAITRHDRPSAVLLSYEEFQALAGQRAPNLDSLTAQFDALLAGMQTAKARQGMQAAFDATPQALGRAAVRAARGTVSAVGRAAPAAREAAPAAYGAAPAAPARRRTRKR